MPDPLTLGRLALVAISFSALAMPPPALGQEEDNDRVLWTGRWSPDGSLLAVGGLGTLDLLDSDSYEASSLILSPAADAKGVPDGAGFAVTRVAWHPQGHLLAVNSQGKNVSGLYNLRSGERTVLTSSPQHYGRGLSWNPEGTRLAFTDDDRLIIADAYGKTLHDIPRHDDAKGLTGVSWSPKGDRIVTIGNRITLHDSNGKPLRQIVHRPRAQESLQLLLCVEWHPSGDYFAVGDYGTEADDPVIQFWSREGVLLMSTALEGDTQVRNLAWSPDGSRLASVSRKLRIWKRSGDLEFEGESPELLWGVDWHPDGNTIVTTSINGRITLWNSRAEEIKRIAAPTGTKQPTEPVSPNELPPHPDKE